MSDPQESPLLQSAQDFLVESLRNLGNGRVSFAILHAITAVELALKEELWRLNPALIFRNIDSRKPSEELTVALSAIPQRLANLGMPLEDSTKDLILETSQWRHEIVHQVGRFDSRRAKQQIGRLLDFLADHFRTHLQMPLESFLPKDLYKQAHSLLDDWQVAVAEAASRADKAGTVLEEACPRCGSTSVMSLGLENKVHCHLCRADLYRTDRCDGCGRPTLVQHMTLFGENYCDDCIDAAGDQYVQHQIDLLRGK